MRRGCHRYAVVGNTSGRHVTTSTEAFLADGGTSTRSTTVWARRGRGRHGAPFCVRDDAPPIEGTSAQLASLPPAVVRLRWCDLCCGPPQRHRFDANAPEVVVACSEERDRVVNFVCEVILRPCCEEPPRICVTGCSGNGKSHNLLRVVQRLRCMEPNVVVTFVHDAGQCVADSPMVLLEELRFGMQRYVDAWCAPGAASTVMEAVNDHLAGNSTLRCTFESTRDTEMLVDSVKEKILSSQMAFKAALRCDDTRHRPHFVLVLDQDERLVDAIRRRRGHDIAAQNAQVAHDVTNLDIFDAVVFASSPDNQESWRSFSRGGMITQRIDPLPRECAAALFPATLGDEAAADCALRDAVVGVVESQLGRYAVAWGWASRALQEAGDDGATPETVCGRVLSLARSFLAYRSRVFRASHSAHFRESEYANALLQGCAHGAYDKSLFQMTFDNFDDSEVRSLLPVFPLAMSVARIRLVFNSASVLDRFECHHHGVVVILQFMFVTSRWVGNYLDASSVFMIPRPTPCVEDLPDEAGTVLLIPQDEPVTAFLVRVTRSEGRRRVSIVALHVMTPAYPDYTVAGCRTLFEDTMAECGAAFRDVHVSGLHFVWIYQDTFQKWDLLKCIRHDWVPYVSRDSEDSLLRDLMRCMDGGVPPCCNGTCDRHAAPTDSASSQRHHGEYAAYWGCDVLSSNWVGHSELRVKASRWQH